MSQIDTASRIDDLVRRTRALASPAAVEQRAVPRSSVAELAATDWETVRDRLHKQRVDDRGPVEKFLDLLDAPRNQLFALAAPGLERRARQRGERGAGGTGRVYFSDVLGELGMPEGIARGALGFGGDVLFDPLTWVGGAIFGTAAKGAKVTTESGRAVRVAGAGIKALKAAEKGKAVAPEVKRIADLAGGTEGLRAKVFGKVVPKGGPVRETVSRVKRAVLGGDQAFDNTGLLAKYADKATTEATGESAEFIKAFDDFLLKFGDGTGAGIRLGRKESGGFGASISTKRGTGGIPTATQQIGHLPIPGTDFGLYVPAMSRRAQEAAATLARAGQTATKIGVVGHTINTARINTLNRATEEFRGMTDAYAAARDDYLGFSTQHGDTLRTMYTPGAESTLVPGDNAIKSEHLKKTAALDAMQRDLKAKREQIAAIRDGIETDKTPRTLGQILLTNEKVREGMARAQMMDRRVAGLQDELALGHKLKATDAKRLEDGSKTIDRLLDFAQKERLPGMGPLLASTPDGLGHMLPDDLDLVHRVGERVRGKLDEYAAVKEGVVAAQKKGDATEAQKVIPNQVDQDLARLRNEIWELTAPLRQNATRTPDEIRETIKARWRETLNTSQQDLLARMDAEEPINELGLAAARTINKETGLIGDAQIAAPPSTLANEVDRLHADMKTVVDDAFARQGSVLASLTDEQRNVLRLVGDTLGTNDPIVNTAFLTPIDTVAKWVSGSSDNAVSEAVYRLGERARRTFSGPPSLVEDAVRHAQRSLGDQAERNVERWLRGAVTELNALATKHGLTAKDGDLATLATGFVIRNLERTGVGRPFRIEIKGKPTGFAAHLDELTKKGILNPKTNPGLADDLEAFARKHGNDLLRTITDAEKADDILGLSSTRGAYLPGGFSRAAKEASTTLMRSVAEGGTTTDKARLDALEAFQREKMTDSAIFDSEVLGREVELFEADRVAQGMGDKAIEAIEDPTVREHFRDTKRAFDEYDRMPVQPQMMQNDPMRINELFAKGRFRVLVGTDDVPGSFFDTNLLSLMSSRFLQHEHATARKTLEELVLVPNMLPVNAKSLGENATKIGAMVDIGNGVQGKVVKLAGGQNGLEVGGQIYRALKGDVRQLGSDHPLGRFLSDRGKSALYPVGVAEPIERLADLLKPDAAKEWLKGVDYVSRLIKSGMLMRVGWTIGNMVGETLNFTINDGNFPAAMVKYGKAVIRAFATAKNPEALRRVTLDVRGETVHGDELIDLIRAPVSDANRFTEPNTRLARGIGEAVPSRLGTFRQSLPGRGAWTADKEAMTRHYAASGGTGGVKDYLKVRKDLFTDRFSRWMVEPWFRANGMVSDVLRSIALLSLMDQGWSHAQAVNKMLNAGFDYSRLTGAERGVAQRLFPFWSWMKNNGIYQAKMLLEHPIYAGSLPLVQHAIEESINGDKRLPMNARPSWLREQFAVQLGTDPLRRSALGMAGFLPQEQAVQWGSLLTGGTEGAQSFARYGATSLNPIVRTPLEIGTGREFFSGRTIGPASDQPDITIGEHVTNQIAPLREYGKKLPEVIGEQGLGAGAIRLLVGGRAQPMTDERIRLSKVREFKDIEAKLRRAMRTADFKKDPERRAVATYRLLDLYRTMVEQGYEDEVPKWAQKQLDTLTPASV